MAQAPNPVDKYVGSRVRMRRVLLGMSQEKLGDALELTFQQIQKYEKGTNRVSASRLQQIAKALKVPPSFFFEGVPTGDAQKPGFADDSVSSQIVDFLSSMEGLHLNRAFAKISDPKIRKKIVELVVALAQSDAGASDTVARSK